MACEGCMMQELLGKCSYLNEAEIAQKNRGEQKNPTDIAGLLKRARSVKKDNKCAEIEQLDQAIEILENLQ